MCDPRSIWSPFVAEFPLVALGGLAARNPNAMATGPFGSSIGSRTFRAVGVPVIRGSNLSADVGKRLVEDNFVFIESELAGELHRSQVVAGDLAFPLWGPINHVGPFDESAHD